MAIMMKLNGRAKNVVSMGVRFCLFHSLKWVSRVFPWRVWDIIVEMVCGLDKPRETEEWACCVS